MDEVELDDALRGDLEQHLARALRPGGTPPGALRPGGGQPLSHALRPGKSPPHDGCQLTVTKDHRIVVPDEGWKFARSLREGEAGATEKFICALSGQTQEPIPPGGSLKCCLSRPPMNLQVRAWGHPQGRPPDTGAAAGFPGLLVRGALRPSSNFKLGTPQVHWDRTWP